jgi:pimeloyl-ACP methyl ester carboxylesterase
MGQAALARLRWCANDVCMSADRSGVGVPGQVTTTYRPRLFRSWSAEREVMADYSRILSTWPVPYTTQSIPTRHGATFVVSSGPESGCPVVLLPGVGSNAVSWLLDVGVLAVRFRVHVVDTAGDPGRSEPVRADWHSPAYAEWLDDVLNGLGATRAYLVGISQGGWNALTFATTWPERVALLVLLAPAGVCAPRPRFLLRDLPLALFGSGGRRVFNRRIAAGRLPSFVLSYVDNIADDFGTRLAVPPLFRDEELARLDMPVLVLVGDRDVIFSAAHLMARMRRLVPHVRTAVIAVAGHALVGLADRIGAFFAETLAAPGPVP